MNKKEIKNKKNKLYTIGQHVVRSFVLSILITIVAFALKAKILSIIFGFLSIWLLISFFVIVTKISKCSKMLE